MVRKSRFLKQGSMPPSSNRLSANLSSERSLRASSTTPSRDFRASSTAPMRATSLAPSAASIRTYRSTSLAPVRASSVAPYRASSVAPYRASSVAPYRASSVAPMRATSVALYSQPTIRASSTVPYSTLYRSQRSSSLPPQSVTFRTTPLVTTSYATPRIDTTIPTRQFGTRLGVSKMETSVKPAIYDEYYGTTYVPSGGRDSWSAYRISDETLDDNDDLVYESAKKDHEVMKKVNKQIVEALSVPAPVFIPVAPAYKRFTPQPSPKIIHVPVQPEVLQLNSTIPYKRAPPRQPNMYRETTPVAKVSYSTVFNGSDLLRPKNKLIANETVDLARPATYSKLKERLRDARANMDRNKTSLNKYSVDPELRAISSEVEAIRNAREMRAQNLSKYK